MRWLPTATFEVARGATGTAGTPLRGLLTLTAGEPQGVRLTADGYGVVINEPGGWMISVEAEVHLASAGSCTLYPRAVTDPLADEWLEPAPRTDPAGAAGVSQRISGSVLLRGAHVLTVRPQVVATADISNLAELSVTVLRVA